MQWWRLFLFAGGFARLIGSCACRVARVSLSSCRALRTRSLRGKTRLLGDRPTGGAALWRDLVLGGSGIECGL